MYEFILTLLLDQTFLMLKNIWQVIIAMFVLILPFVCTSASIVGRGAGGARRGITYEHWF